MFITPRFGGIRLHQEQQALRPPLHVAGHGRSFGKLCSFMVSLRRAQAESKGRARSSGAQRAEIFQLWCSRRHRTAISGRSAVRTVIRRAVVSFQRRVMAARASSQARARPRKRATRPWLLRRSVVAVVGAANYVDEGLTRRTRRGLFLRADVRVGRLVATHDVWIARAERAGACACAVPAAPVTIVDQKTRLAGGALGSARLAIVRVAPGIYAAAAAATAGGGAATLDVIALLVGAVDDAVTVVVDPVAA